MRQKGKLLLAGLTAAFILASAVGTASANRLSVDERNFRVTWTMLEFVAEGHETVLCAVTLEGSFHSNTIAKVEGSLIGHITRAIKGATCTGGAATILTATLPWHVTYESFGGILPNITEIDLLLVGASFRVHPNGDFAACLARTTVTDNVSGTVTLVREAGGLLKTERMFPDESDEIPCVGPFGITINGRFAEPIGGPVTRLGSSTRILVRLI